MCVNAFIQESLLKQIANPILFDGQGCPWSWKMISLMAAVVWQHMAQRWCILDFGEEVDRLESSSGAGEDQQEAFADDLGMSWYIASHYR